MPEYTTPEIYIEEVVSRTGSVTSVPTAIPAFIGYTEIATLDEPGDLLNKPFRIESLEEYEKHFGKAFPEQGIEITFEMAGNHLTVIGTLNEKTRTKYLLHYSLQLFFLNGGGPCYIVAVGNYNDVPLVKVTDMERGLQLVKNVDEVTLLLFPDAIKLENFSSYYSLYKKAMEQCAELEDRFTILTVFHRSNNISVWKEDAELLRSSLDIDNRYLRYAAAYFPRLYTNIPFNTEDGLVKIVSSGAGELPGTLADLKSVNEAYYDLALNAISNIEMRLPASPAVAGVYAQTDKIKGVWKAPANVNIDAVVRPEYVLTQQDQEELNGPDSNGKYINVIRTFVGRGPAIIWGARTLAGDDNEWKYISVRRYCNMVGESCKEATEALVFDPNNSSTWNHVKLLIGDYLLEQWRAGALTGAKPEQAFFVNVGLGLTMTQADIDSGRMIVEIGLAVVRPAEFIVLRFSHAMVPDHE